MLMNKNLLQNYFINSAMLTIKVIILVRIVCDHKFIREKTTEIKHNF